MICDFCGSITDSTNDYFFEALDIKCCECKTIASLCDVCFELYSFEVFHDMMYKK